VVEVLEGGISRIRKLGVGDFGYDFSEMGIA